MLVVDLRPHVRGPMLRQKRFDDFFHFYAARTFHQQQISRLQQLRYKSRGIRG